MKVIELTNEEKRIVALFARMSPDAKVRFPTWLVELGLPFLLAIGGLLTGNNILVGAAFGCLIAVHAHRLFRQFAYSRALQSICSKLQAHLGGQDPGA